jgi:hypothetical protein
MQLKIHQRIIESVRRGDGPLRNIRSSKETLLISDESNNMLTFKFH